MSDTKRLREISLGKETHLKFQVAIEGTAQQPEARLSLSFPDYTLSFPAELKEKNTVHVTIPKLPFLENTSIEEVSAALEIVVENQYFVPWEDMLGVKKEVKVGIQSFDQDPVPTLSIKSTRPSIDISETSSQPNPRGSAYSSLNKRSIGGRKTSERLAALRGHKTL